jgi:hypothetical protein
MEKQDMVRPEGTTKSPKKRPVNVKRLRDGGQSRPASLEQSSATYVIYEKGVCNYRDKDTKELCRAEAAVWVQQGKRRCYGHLAG